MPKDLDSRIVAEMSRRNFLRRGAMFLGGAALAGPAFAAQRDCQTTPSQVMGPFYRFGAPFQNRLVGPDEPGDHLTVTGTVRRADCSTPVPGALIEVWQANSAGIYDTQEPGNFTQHVDFHLRGMMYTNELGQYELETIVPGRYAVPPNLPGLEQYGGLTRPAHIHFRVIDSLNVPVTTQLYFNGDPYITDDPWASKEPTLAIDLEQDGKRLRGAFDVVLGSGL